MILSPFIPKPIQLLRVRNYRSLPLRDKWELPRTSGVYYAIRGFKILYIGKSTNINARWNSYQFGPHHKLEELIQVNDSIGDIDLHYREWDEALIGFIEAVEIKRFAPPMNKRKEKVWENINLAVIGFCLKYYGTEALMLGLSAAVVALLAYHFVF